MRNVIFLTGWLFITLIGSIYGQGFDAQYDFPVTLSSDTWRPLIPRPFEGCDLIVYHDFRSHKMQIRALLKNRGYRANIEGTDSTVTVTINCVAEDVAAFGQAPVIIPDRFNLFVRVEDSDSANYRVEYANGLLKIENKYSTPSIRLETPKILPAGTIWLQFNGNRQRELSRIERLIAGAGSIILADTGYYNLGVPMLVTQGNARRARYNKTDIGTIIFIQPANAEHQLELVTLLDIYKESLVAYGRF